MEKQALQIELKQHWPLPGMHRSLLVTVFAGIATVKVLVAGGVGRLHDGKQSLAQGIDDSEGRKPVKVDLKQHEPLLGLDRSLPSNVLAGSDRVKIPGTA